jgi:hypothetical protein
MTVSCGAEISMFSNDGINGIDMDGKGSEGGYTACREQQPALNSPFCCVLWTETAL